MPELLIGREELAVFPLPVHVPDITISQTWHPRFDADNGHRLLRRCLKQCASSEILSGPRRFWK
jgi:DNA-binding transcriptional LysR family regulator